MEQSNIRDLSSALCEIFDDSFDEPCLSPGAFISHSTITKKSPHATISEDPD